MKLRYKTLEAPKHYSNKRGLAERLIKRHLKKTGHTVWRGGYIHAPLKEEVWPNVLIHYTKLHELLAEHNADIRYLCWLSKKHKGMPDYICYKDNKIHFVECKLEYEQLSEKQQETIKILHQQGFETIIYKLVYNAKSREWVKNVCTGEKEIMDKQLRLKKHW